MLEAILAVSAIVPSALLVWYFHARDIFPEPPRVLWITFLLGAFTILPIGIIEVPIDALLSNLTNPYLIGILKAFCVAAIPEEVFKLGVLVFYSLRSPAFDEPMDGIVYGVVASLGFATVENLLYVFDGGLGTAVIRAFTAVPMHAFLGAVLGYYVGQAFVHRDRQWRWIATGYCAAVALHGWYDSPLLTLDAFGDTPLWPILVCLSLSGLVFSGVWAVRVTRRLHLAQRLLPVPPGPAAAPGVPRLRGRRLGIVQLVAGGGIATLGGMILLGILLSFVMGLVGTEHRWTVLVGSAIIGGLPLALGVVLFIMGIRRLNASAPHGNTPATPPPSPASV